VKIYLAGPMFTAADAAWNLALAARLRGLGYEVFCPNESEPNDKTRTDVTARLIYEVDIAAVEWSNVVLYHVSEDSGANWEAGYMDCLSKKVDPARWWGVVGLATDIRLQTPPDPAKPGVENQAGYANALVVGGLQGSLGVYQSLDALLDRLAELQREREAAEAG